MFIPQPGDIFVRRIEEENATVTARFEQNALRLEISPSITTLDGHNGKRLTAGVYFEIACRYAEKVDGVVTQLSNIQACANANGGSQNVAVAKYPEQPLSWENVCHGFAEVIAGGHVHDDYDEPIAY
jgi:hypothetical protein